MAGNTADASEDMINIKVYDEVKETLNFFFISKQSTFENVKAEFVQKNGLLGHRVRFRYHFDIIIRSDTPLSLKMEEGDTVYAYYSQLPAVIHRRSIETPQDASEVKITISVRNAMRNTSKLFNLKKKTPLRKVMAWFIQRNGLSGTRVIFRYNLNIVSGPDTPLSLNMVDGDVIYAYYFHIIPRVLGRRSIKTMKTKL